MNKPFNYDNRTDVIDVRTLRQAFPVFIDGLPEPIKRIIDPPFERFMEWIMALEKARFIVADNRTIEDGIDFVEAMLKSAGIDVGMHNDLTKIPRTGRLLVVCNHPTGIPDMAILPIIGRVRRDIKIVLNPIFSKMTGHEGVHRMLIPVPIFSKPTDEQRTEFRNRIEDALREENAVIFFPAAEVAHRWKKQFYKGTPLDARWKTGVLHYASNTGTPVVPVCIHAGDIMNPKNTRLFYFIRKFGVIGAFVSQMRIFREVLHQLKQTEACGKRRCDVTVLDPVSPERINEWLGLMDYGKAVDILRRMVNEIID